MKNNSNFETKRGKLYYAGSFDLYFPLPLCLPVYRLVLALFRMAFWTCFSFSICFYARPFTFPDAYKRCFISAHEPKTSFCTSAILIWWSSWVWEKALRRNQWPRKKEQRKEKSARRNTRRNSALVYVRPHSSCTSLPLSNLLVLSNLPFRRNTLFTLSLFMYEFLDDKENSNTLITERIQVELLRCDTTSYQAASLQSLIKLLRPLLNIHISNVLK